MNGKIGLSHMEKHRYEPVQNVSKITIPPFAPMMAGSISLSENNVESPSNAITLFVHPFAKIPEFIDTPSGDVAGFGFNSPLLMNGPTTIPPGGHGKATRDFPAPAIIHESEFAIGDLRGIPLYPLIPTEEGVAATAMGRYSYDLIGWRAHFASLFRSYPTSDYRYTTDSGFYISHFQGDSREKTGLAWITRPQHSPNPSVDAGYARVSSALDNDADACELRSGFPPADWMEDGEDGQSLLITSPGVFDVSLNLKVSGTPAFDVESFDTANIAFRLAESTSARFVSNLSTVQLTAAPQMTQARCATTSSGCSVFLYGAAFEHTYGVNGRIFVSVESDWADTSAETDRLAAKLELLYTRSGNYSVSVEGDLAIARLTRSTLQQDNESEE